MAPSTCCKHLETDVDTLVLCGVIHELLTTKGRRVCGPARVACLASWQFNPWSPVVAQISPIVNVWLQKLAQAQSHSFS